MKSVLLLSIILCAMLYACNNKSTTEQAKADTTQKLTYPFKPKYSLNWQPGDEKNAVIVLNCLKKYIAGVIPG